MDGGQHLGIVEHIGETAGEAESIQAGGLVGPDFRAGMQIDRDCGVTEADGVDDAVRDHRRSNDVGEIEGAGLAEGGGEALLPEWRTGIGVQCRQRAGGKAGDENAVGKGRRAGDGD